MSDLAASVPSEPCPRCLRLRTKMDYVTADPSGRPSGRPREWDEHLTLGGTAHYYCLHTLTVIGPDEDVVGPRLCGSDRNCYEHPGF